jgi:hypothetical protein
VNEGKAMALNDAIPCTRGEIILVIDADAAPARDILRWIVPHFRWARVAAVTGNPRVANRNRFLTELQVIEFSSIVSLLRAPSAAPRFSASACTARRWPRRTLTSPGNCSGPGMTSATRPAPSSG